MNYRRACDILLIDQGSISLEVIRKQYKLLALKYHPDKNAAENAADMYRVIKDAHDYLIDGISEATGSEATGSEATGSEDLDLDEDFDDNDLDEDLNDDSTPASKIYQKIKETNSYFGIAASFIESLYNNKTFQKQIFHPLLMRILFSCEEKGLQLFESLDKPRAQKIMDILVLYSDAFHISASFLEKAQNILDLKIDKIEVDQTRVVLNPNIDDLYNQSVFKLRIDENTNVLVPLWFSELIYEKENTIVECIPELPDHITLDEHNNIHVRLSYLISEVWKMEIIEVAIGPRIFKILTRDLKLMRYQIFAHMREGIPVPDEKDIFSTHKISNVIIHFLLDL
jgi:hypothetical protein